MLFTATQVPAVTPTRHQEWQAGRGITDTPGLVSLADEVIGG